MFIRKLIFLFLFEGYHTRYRRHSNDHKACYACIALTSVLRLDGCRVDHLGADAFSANVTLTVVCIIVDMTYLLAVLDTADIADITVGTVCCVSARMRLDHYLNTTALAVLDM